MKTTHVLVAALVAVTVSVSAFASEPVNSKVVVLKSKSDVFKVIYSALKPGRVSLKLVDQYGRELFSETIQSSNGFIRPINVSELPEGQYSIAIEDTFGKIVKELNYQMVRNVRNVRLTKIAGDDNKILFTGMAAEKTEVAIRIMNISKEVIFEQSLNVQGNFGEVYNLTNLVGGYTVEVSDNNGIIESIVK